MSLDPFYRIGQPVRIPASPTSGGTPFDCHDKLPMSVTDLTFMFINNSPYDIRLEGTPMNDDGSVPTDVAVTGSTGWMILARSIMGPFTSKRPYYLNVIVIDTPAAPAPADADYSNVYLELVYGRGT